MNSKDSKLNKQENNQKESDLKHKELSDNELDKVVGGVATVERDGVNCYYFKHCDVYSYGTLSVQIWTNQYIPMDTISDVYVRAYIPGKNGDKPKFTYYPSNHNIFKDCYYLGKVPFGG